MSANKSESQRVRLTKEENEAFESYAKKHNINRSALLRKLIREQINAPYPDLLEDEQSVIRIAIRDLSGIARNLNQVTTAINTGKYAHRNLDESYLNEIKSYVMNVKNEFINYIEITRKRYVINTGNDNNEK